MANNTSTAERKLLAIERLAARKRQVVRIRKWVAGVAVSIFIALWVVLFAQLVSGHDPALASGSSSQRNSQTTAAAQPTTSSQSSTDTSNQTSDQTSSSSSSSSSSGTSAITTSQS